MSHRIDKGLLLYLHNTCREMHYYLAVCVSVCLCVCVSLCPANILVFYFYIAFEGTVISQKLRYRKISNYFHLLCISYDETIKT